MPLLFEGGAPGRVVALSDPAVQQGRARFVRSTPELATYDDHLSIITRLGISERANFQVLHPVGNSLYIYVFGDKAGRMVLSGICFPERCDEPGGTHGLERAIRNYRANRISARTNPILITVGTLVFESFLEGGDFTTLDAQSELAAFTLQIMTVPEKPQPSNTQPPPAATPAPSSGVPLRPAIPLPREFNPFTGPRI